MNRVPIRARLTGAFALAMILVLAGAGLFVYLRLREDLDDALNAGLRTRANAQAELGRESSPLRHEGAIDLDDREDSFAQLYGPDGRLLDAVGAARAPTLRPAELRRASRGVLVVDRRRVEGLEDEARVLARPVGGTRRGYVVAVGQTLDDRDEALSGVVSSFAIGGALAVLLASAIGYGLATAGLAPVEAMRRRAERVSLARDEGLLPLPAAHDEVRRLGQTLNEMLDRLRRSFERERRFVTDAGHEIRTPIAVVKTELENALRTGDYGPQVREALIAAVEECDHLAQLADDLLLIARAGEGALPVRPERLAAAPLLEGVRDRFADRAAQQGRRIVIKSPPDLDVLADPLRLRQALGNLVDNALRHGRGDVTLRCAPAPGGVELAVADEGPGFEADIVDRAFERFARGKQARTRGGTGLGMAIVRAVAEAHGGRATVVPGRRPTVAIWLPAPASDLPDGARERQTADTARPSHAPLT
jgi:signal transduction histidine kinase